MTRNSRKISYDVFLSHSAKDRGAHALNKQVLLMTQSIDDVPFDLRHRRALVYEYSPRGCKKLEKDLYDNVQNMLSQHHEG